MAYNWDNELSNQSRRQLIDRTSLYLSIVAFIAVLASMAYFIGDMGWSNFAALFHL